jgi:eukaryotic-like serine/threonine-protein kinase
MNPERWKLIKELFNAAIDKMPVERAPFLEQICNGDEQLRREVEKLIAAHEKPDLFIDKPAYEAAAEMLVDEPAESLTGRSIGHYRVERKLGQGGMGEVFSAFDTRLDRAVALKILPEHSMRDPERVRRFKQEARAASLLNHPNIVTIYDIGDMEERRFIATELIDGENLRERMSRDTMKLSEILDITLQTANALSAAHQAGIVHRDIKPENIMLRRDGFVKVVDFGLAKLTERQKAMAASRVSTESGIVMGTVRYMSPEQARGIKIDILTDIFSLGVVLYEMVTGRLPFDGETNSDVIVSILTKEAPPLSRYVEDAPEELERIVERALRKNREERYQSVKEMIDDLEALKEGMALLRRRSGGQELSLARTSPANESTVGDNSEVATLKVVSRKTSSTQFILNEVRRHKRALITSLAALIVLSTVTVAAIYKSNNKNTMASQWLGQPFDIMKLTDNGNTFDGHISPDGKRLLYMAISKGGKHSLWIKEIATGKESQIVPPAKVFFWYYNFSRDGNNLFYLVEDQKDTVGGTLYRIPTLGGEPQKLLKGLGTLSLSPDEKTIAFTRWIAEGEKAVMLANIDGSNERVLAVRKDPNIFFDLSWSPDGKQIAATVINKDSDVAYMTVVALLVDGGAELPLTKKRWSPRGGAVGVQWLPDGSGLLLNAAEEGANIKQIWLVSYPSGEAQKLTNDFNNYRIPGITADGSTIVMSTIGRPSTVWAVPPGKPEKARRITNSSGVYDDISCTADGRLILQMVVNDKDHISIMDADGSNPKQLTSGANHNYRPVMSPDGKYIVFTSNRSGNFNVWRMNSDGSNPVQLTKGESGYPVSITPDGKWIFYSSFSTGRWAINKIPLEGGDPVKFREIGYPSTLAFSPDGSLLAYQDLDKTLDKYRIFIVSVENGEIVKILDNSSHRNIRWSRDGQAIAYVDENNGITEIWQQPITGGPRKLLTDFKVDETLWFDWSLDGKELLCVRGASTSDLVMIKNWK